jgi:protein phosphatase 1 regulatory subunit 37
MIRDYPLTSTSSSASSDMASTLSASSLNGHGPSSVALDSPSLSAQLGMSTSSSFFAPEGSNSVTARQRPLPPPPPSAAIGTNGVVGDEGGEDGKQQAEKEAWSLSQARLKLQRQVEELPRVGALLTLDVKGNDLRVRFCLFLSPFPQSES